MKPDDIENDFVDIHAAITKCSEIIEKLSLIIENQNQRIQALEKVNKKTLYTVNGLQ